MRRRFVNLVTRNCAQYVYSVRHIDPFDQLFYRSAKEALEAADEAARMKDPFPAMRALQLPHPGMSFMANPSGGDSLDMFALFSPRATSGGRMVAANPAGEAVMYDADRQLVSTLGCMNERKGVYPMCLHIAHPGRDQDSLYVMDTYPGPGDDGCFEVLEYMPECSELSDLRAAWRWRLLPPPPFVRQPGYRRPSSITAYAAVVDGNGCSTIYVTCEGSIGTYSFETARLDSHHRLGWTQSEEWKHVGRWSLPFKGGAQYVPEFNMWFGFSAFSPGYLCALDLSAMHHDRPPTALQVWQNLIPPEVEWMCIPVRFELLNLGDGKFLIAGTFEAETTGQQFALLTGVEMMPCVGDDRSLQMVKHKCARYAFTSDAIEWVL
ncbi:hypothetical protein CFC21_088960 [Triticum aestivum]|uniref:DUF1618 domain-containing protein n=2 Tax=Triticum aestivum TaxID=4565 RepID=A0A3B6PNS1_WHEAT|nr:hypothetical protein CFC21_088960 [Triticum aestivum]